MTAEKWTSAAETVADRHRSLGVRAWCGDCRTYCHRDDWCDCCHEARGHVKTWVTQTITCALCNETGEQGGWYRTHPLCTSCTDGLRELDDFEGRRLVRPVEQVAT
jgi:hypothetical protein